MPIHIIDDDPIIRNLLLELAAEFSDQTITFTDAREYLTYMQNAAYRDPRLIITDVIMPEISGLELTRILRRQGLNCKILVISGNFSDHEEKPHESVCAMVHKPFEISRMQTLMGMMLSCQCQHTLRDQYPAIGYWPGFRMKCPQYQSDISPCSDCTTG